ncbi:hypothetical protein [Weissella cibaria]|uniref:hypothetical protein n=1 Tax=Weissella cibaria TaxID=137591 RepID=UPI001368DD39|nr:hypothetical protein [Weissella cibaria]MDY2519624.1 hypothetical protein [Weissella cibaria]MYV35334.1 hypothetical protein [Weissella cibaria]
MMDQTTLAVFFGLMLMGMALFALVGVIAYYSFIGLKYVWLKRLGPAVYYLLTGDAKALPDRKVVI